MSTTPSAHAIGPRSIVGPPRTLPVGDGLLCRKRRFSARLRNDPKRRSPRARGRDQRQTRVVAACTCGRRLVTVLDCFTFLAEQGNPIVSLGSRQVDTCGVCCPTLRRRQNDLYLKIWSVSMPPATSRRRHPSPDCAKVSTSPVISPAFTT